MPSLAPPALDSALQALETLIETVVAPAATRLDATGDFPREAVDALGKAGLLSLVSSPEVGGLGQGPRAAAQVVERLAQVCGSTAMVVAMHYSATAVIEAFGPRHVREAIAQGRHLTTLAFSEAGSRSHFWAPTSTAQPSGDGVRLDAKKSWVTSAGEADSYVWSSRPVAAEGASTIWLVDAGLSGLSVAGPFDGLGLRGNSSSPISADGVIVSQDAMLGADGAGFDVMMGTVLPMFSVLNAAFSVGTMEDAVQQAARHVAGTGFAHLGQNLAELPTIRSYVARMRIQADMARLLLDDTLTAMETQRPDAMLRVLESKAAAGEASLEVTELAMRVCGGAAFRKENGLERHFRDARAATVMAPTTDVLYDFIGKAVCGLPLF